MFGPPATADDLGGHHRERGLQAKPAVGQREFQLSRPGEEEEMARFSVPLFLNITAQRKTGITWETLSSFLDKAPCALPVVAIVQDPWGQIAFFARCWMPMGNSPRG